MSKYTMELRRVCDIYGYDEVKSWFMSYDEHDYLTEEEINVIKTRGTWSKERLAEKIIRNYYFREIGLETPEMFKHYVINELSKIMETKLLFIYSASIKIDPLINVDYMESYEMERNSTGESNTNLTSTGKNTNTGSGLQINSDTPQGLIDKNEILKGKYASSTGATEGSTTLDTSDTSTGNDTSKGNTKETWTRHKKGNDGITATQQKLIAQYRRIIIGIDKDIINELGDLFMGIY